jgi:hypothetical protein
MIKWIRNLFYKKEKIKPNYIEWFHIDKHYYDMTRREKREYKRWLHKNNCWDGSKFAVLVFELLQNL